jgi:hypothetical protein
MALSNKALQSVNSLDFDTIKSDLVTYLSSQDTFKDYNFEGAGMAILLDILSYNTHHMGFYANMLANESFLDSCQLRSSAVSISKSTGYTPRSRRGAEVVVDIKMEINPSASPAALSDLVSEVNSNFYNILRNEVFSCSFGGENFYFYAVNTVYFKYEGVDTEGKPVIYARNVLLREGRLRSKTFVVNNTFGEDQRFIIPDVNLDDRSVSVFVRKSLTESEGSTDTWFKSSNIIDNNSQSKIFFLQEVYDGKYEVYFGDGILGQSLTQGNVIVVTYASCSGSDGNGIGLSDSDVDPTFSYITSTEIPNGVSDYLVRLLIDDNSLPQISYGGQEKETMSSIKYYAPRLYETQNRAVTLNDYITLLQSNYSGSLRSIHAWGGEDNNPPEYGKVFISIRPRTGLFLTTQEKLSIENSILEERNIVSITPRVIDPEYLYISPTLNVKYDPRLTNSSADSIRASILTYVRDFGIQNLSAFEKNFFSGQLTKNVIDINQSIKSCSLSINVSKIIYPVFNTKFSYLTSFENPLSPITGTTYIQSSTFLTYGNSPNANDLPSVRAYFKDNGSGKITLYNESTQRVIRDNFGSVDYSTGDVRLNSAEFLLGDNLRKYEVTIFAKPSDTDVFSRRNTILEMDTENITVNMTQASTVRM